MLNYDHELLNMAWFDRSVTHGKPICTVSPLFSLGQTRHIAGALWSGMLMTGVLAIQPHLFNIQLYIWLDGHQTAFL